MLSAMRFSATTRVIGSRVATRSFSSEVAVNEVARVIRGKVSGEESALNADAVLHSALPKLQEQPGFVKVSRQLCKTEWVHESSIVFNNIDNFKAFVGSDLHDELTGPTGLLEKLGGKDSVYLGARVYDEFGSA